ncbi:MAG: hypothetical protein K0S45_4191 [Nitrospira sp.]|nr:hypothetical protein [Nitrospira sp.]
MTSSSESAATVGLVRKTTVGDAILSQCAYSIPAMTADHAICFGDSCRGASSVQPALVCKADISAVSYNEVIQDLNP